MSSTNIVHTLRRMLHRKEQLNKKDAVRLRELLLADGYLSRSERKLIRNAIHNNLLDDVACQIISELLIGNHEHDVNRNAA
jgi:hypothetical protein